MRLIERTDVIAGQLGRIFGIRVQVNAAAPLGQTLTKRIRHHRLTAASGRSGTETSYRTATPPGQRELGSFFAFEHTYEIAEGDWTFEVVHDGGCDEEVSGDREYVLRWRRYRRSA